ncbi:uncharacterized protein LOC144569790 [Carex rostrata]
MSNQVEAPYAVLDLLGDYMANYADHLSFKAVCKLWHLAESGHPAPPAELPWLRLTSSDGTHKFYEICSRNYYVNPIPRIDSSASFFGSHSDGWMLCYSDSPKRIFINSAYSGEKFSLPPITIFCLIPIPFDECASSTCEWINMKGVSMVKTVFSCSPSSKDYLVASINQQGCSLTISRPKSNNSRATTVHLGGEGLESIIFYNNELIGVNKSKMVYSFNIEDTSIGLAQVTSFHKFPTKKFEFSVPTFSNRKANYSLMYLVEISNKLLMVLKHYGHSDCTNTLTVGFNVYELIWKNPLEWLEVKNLQGHAIFLDSYISRVFHASHLPGIKGDHIYFTSSSASFDTGVFSMKEQSISCILPAEHFSSHSKPVWLFPPNCCQVCILSSS